MTINSQVIPVTEEQQRVLRLARNVVWLHTGQTNIELFIDGVWVMACAGVLSLSSTGVRYIAVCDINGERARPNFRDSYFDGDDPGRMSTSEFAALFSLVTGGRSCFA